MKNNLVQLRLRFENQNFNNICEAGNSEVSVTEYCWESIKNDLRHRNLDYETAAKT